MTLQEKDYDDFYEEFMADYGTSYNYQQAYGGPVKTQDA